VSKPIQATIAKTTIPTIIPILFVPTLFIIPWLNIQLQKCRSILFIVTVLELI
jgi:hypothetical protein